jgi:hypothetical protein
VQPSSSPSAFPSFGMPLFMQYVAAKLLLNYLARPGRLSKPKRSRVEGRNAEWVSARRHAGENLSDRPMDFIAVIVKRVQPSQH